ncbi:MAG TPA: pyruvate kinase [Myxococcota bacterium]|nr:pyruvate kinase [Myxococcota bacterium]
MPNAIQQTRTRIVATLGPASWEPETLGRLIDAGVDVFRINCSHSDAATIRMQVARVRRAAYDRRVPIAILLDLQGPKIRTSKVAAPLELRAGDLLTVVMDEDVIGRDHRVGTTYPEMANDVHLGDRVLFADGALSGTVAAVRTDKTPAEVDIRIRDGGMLGSNKGINLPGVRMSVPSLTEKDLADVDLGVEVGVDYVALSFVRRAQDILGLREHLRTRGAQVPIIAKIEKPEALDHLDDILDVTDGVMVARGDLGVEVPLETVPVHQKRIIAAAAARGRIVITATQMLDSMERNPRPTRAETTDVANAILDGTDAVMLSGETSVGSYPIEAVRVMDAIARSAEQSAFFQGPSLERLPVMDGPQGAACRAACFAVAGTDTPLVVFTWSGDTAIYVSKARPLGPIFALSPLQPVVDRLALAWGVLPYLIPVAKSMEDLIDAGERILLQEGVVRPGQTLVVLGGNAPEHGATSFVKFHVVRQPA